MWERGRPEQRHVGDDFLDRELLLSCLSGLGMTLKKEDTNYYCRTVDTIACLKDLQRFLRNDDPFTRPAFFEMQKLDIVKTELLPLLLRYPDEKDLVFNVVKVATFLSMPVAPESDAVNKQVEGMQKVKEAFLKEGALDVVVSIMVDPLTKLPRIRREEEDAIQLVLAFVRNLLCIPDCNATGGGRGEHRARMTGELVAQLFKAYFMDLFVRIAQHTSSRGALNTIAIIPLMVEILDLIYQGIDASQLIAARLPATRQRASGAQAEPASRSSEAGGAGLISALGAKGRAGKFGQARAAASARHARLGAAFVVNQGGKTAVVMGRPPTSQPLPSLPCHKPKTKLRVHFSLPVSIPTVATCSEISTVEEEKSTRLPSEVMLRLKAFLEQFLGDSYGLLMESMQKFLRQGLEPEGMTAQDFQRFTRLAKLCTAYTFLQQEQAVKDKMKARKENVSAAANRADEETKEGGGTSPYAAISATMGWETFHLVQSLWLRMIDLPPKAPEKDWELQHSSLSLLKEMLLTLDLAHQTGSADDRNTANRMIHRLLHDDQKESGLLPVLSRLLKSFNFRYQPRSHAAEIVQAIHVTLRLLDRLSRAEAGAFIVKRKTAARRKPKSAKRSGRGNEGTEKGEGAEARQGGDQDGSEGAPPANDEPLATGNADGEPAPTEADALPSGEHQDEQGVDAAADAESGEGSQKSERRQEQTAEDMDEEDKEEVRQRATEEVAYNLNVRVRQELAYPAAVHLYTWLLRGYKTNSWFLNHCITAFLKRVASPDGLNLEPMLYQVSVLRVFEQILSDADFCRTPCSAQLVNFCTGLVQNLFTRLLPSKKGGQQAERSGAPTVRSAQAARDKAQNGVLPEIRSGGAGGQEGEREVMSSAEVPPEREAEVQRNLTRMMFVELLLWKNQGESEEVRDEYHWRHIYRRKAMGEEEADSPGGAVRPFGPAMTDEQEKRLRELFEQHGMQKGHLDLIKDAFGEGWTKLRVARNLKSLGLRKGILTETQKSELQRLFQEHAEQRGYLQEVVDKMPGSFTKSQISLHLRKLGLRRGNGTAHISASPSEASGEESDSGGGVVGQGGRRLSAAPAASKRLMAGWSDDDDSDNGQPGGRASGGPAAGNGIEEKDSSDANESSDEEGRSVGTADRQPGARKQSSVFVAEPKQGTALRVVSSDDEEAEKVSAGDEHRNNDSSPEVSGGRRKSSTQLLGASSDEDHVAPSGAFKRRRLASQPAALFDSE